MITNNKGEMIMNDDTKLTLSEPGCEQGTIMCTCSQGETVLDVDEHVNESTGFNFQPLSGRTLTLRGNGGMVNGASTVTMTIASPMTIGNLPRATPLARFLGWSFTPTGPVASNQIAIDSNMTLYARFDATNYNQMTRGELAQEILHRHHRRSLSNRQLTLMGAWGSMTNDARTTVYLNLVDTAAGLAARRAATSNRNDPIGGSVFLTENLLRAILRVNDRFGAVTLNSLAGGRHTTESNHYSGRAVDFQSDNWRVRGPNVRPEPILDYLRGTRGFTTQPNSGYIGHITAFHLDILN